MTDQSPAPLDVRADKPKLVRRISFIWIVPLLALLASLGVAWQNYLDRGTLIEISFENAAGVTAGETVVKYRDVTVGTVEKVVFAEGLAEVLVSVRIDNTVAPYLDDDAQFWVVRPDISVRGITGLDTVLSGVYIEGDWDTQNDVAQIQFIALETPPLTRIDQRGTRIVLRAPNGAAFAAGAPILHRGIEVGFIETPELSFSGTEVRVNAFISAPYDRRITTATRFWDTSGFTVSFGAAGFELDVNSLASLIEGGIAFDTVVSGGLPVRDGQVFDIFYDEIAARESLFSNPNSEVLNVSVLFDGSVSGLTPGSEVRMQGVRIGSVTDLSAIVDTTSSHQRVLLRTNLAIEPARLGLPEDATPEDALSFLSDFVTQGLRARMITGNILSGSLVVELIEVTDAPAANLDLTSEPYPTIPITASQISDVAATAEGVLERINALPVEELMTGAIDMMDSIERLANDDSLRDVPASLTALLDETRALVASDDLQAVPTELRSAIADLNAVISSAADADLIGKLSATLESAHAAAVNIDSASENFPAITAEIESLVAKANALELDALLTEAANTLGAIDTLLSSDSTQALPASVGSALDELRLFLAEVREGGAIENVNAALASANGAATAIEEAASSLPALSQRAGRLVAQIESVIGQYGERSRFNAETLATLRDIQAAADAVSALARTIQRNPSALLTGR